MRPNESELGRNPDLICPDISATDKSMELYGQGSKKTQEKSRADLRM